VTLSGTVDSRRVKHMIEDIVDSVWGVKDITNNLRIQSGSESGQRSGGSWGSTSGRSGTYSSSSGGDGRASGEESETSGQSGGGSRTSGQGSSGKSR